MYKGLVVSVVMPIHNEQAQIEKAINRVPEVVDVIVAVDDGSTDASLQLLRRIDDKRLTVLAHEKNRGVGAATKTGYQHALGTGGDLIAVMDGDGQMDGRDLSRLLDCAVDGADYVKGAGLRVENVPVRTVYGDEVSGVNPFKVVPTILFLIGRGYLRRKLLERRPRSPLARPRRVPS